MSSGWVEDEKRMSSGWVEDKYIPQRKRRALPKIPVKKKIRRRLLPKIPTELDIKVKKLLDVVSPCYKPEAIDAFKKLFSTPRLPKTEITEMRRASKDNVKTFELK